MHDLHSLESLDPDQVHLGVVGYPIVHSKSPVFQNAALKALARTNPYLENWEYHRIEAKVDQLEILLEKCIRLGFRGLNLTLPHKVEVMKFLDSMDRPARQMGAVNTICINDLGEIKGYNTDGYGLLTGIRAELEIDLKGRAVWIAGAGGASRAACVQCLEAGCSMLRVTNRSTDRLDELDQQLKEHPAYDRITFASNREELETMPEESLLIQATSLGLKPDDPLPVSEKQLEQVTYVYDLVYGEHATALVELAKKRGLKAADGRSMLVYQGAKSFELWTGLDAPLDEMFAAMNG